MVDFYIGIDVHAVHDCPYAVLDGDSRLVDSGWVHVDELTLRAGELGDRFAPAAYGIDAPRQPLAEPRRWYWTRREWRPKQESDKGIGRHCEVLLAAHNVATPQWTPLLSETPDWMMAGFKLFKSLQSHPHCYEVFPSASCALLKGDQSVRTDVTLAEFWPSRKDMLDAVLSAITVQEYLAGRGQAVGGGDGLGALILPRPIPKQNPVAFQWPDAVAG